MLQVQPRGDETQRPQSAPNEAASMAQHLFPSLNKRSFVGKMTHLPAIILICLKPRPAAPIVQRAVSLGDDPA